MGRAAVKALVHKVTVLPFCFVLGIQGGWRSEKWKGEISSRLKAGEASFSFTIPYLCSLQKPLSSGWNSIGGCELERVRR